MKHLNKIHAQQRVAERTQIAQEGFLDGLKDFFTSKASRDDLIAVGKTITVTEDAVRRMRRMPEFTRNTAPSITRFVFKRGTPSANLPADIKLDIETIERINNTFLGLIDILKHTTPNVSQEKVDEKTIDIITGARIQLDYFAMLGDVIFRFRERGTDEFVYYRDAHNLNPDMSVDEEAEKQDILFEFQENLERQQRSFELLMKINGMFERTSVTEMRDALKDLAVTLRKTEDLVKEFLAQVERNRKHEDKHVRHVIRYCHNIVGVITWIVTLYRPFIKALD